MDGALWLKPPITRKRSPGASSPGDQRLHGVNPRQGIIFSCFVQLENWSDKKHEWVKTHVWGGLGVNACRTIPEENQRKTTSKAVKPSVLTTHTLRSEASLPTPGTALCVYWTTPLTGNNTWKWRHVTEPSWEIIITNNQTETGH